WPAFEFRFFFPFTLLFWEKPSCDRKKRENLEMTQDVVWTAVAAQPPANGCDPFGQLRERFRPEGPILSAQPVRAGALNIFFGGFERGWFPVKCGGKWDFAMFVVHDFLARGMPAADVGSGRTFFAVLFGRRFFPAVSPHVGEDLLKMVAHCRYSVDGP